MAFKSLQGSYNSWPKLSPENKIDLLEKTEEEIESASTKKVAEFCLYILSGISFESECETHPALNDPVRKLSLKIQSKKSDASDLEYVGYLVNKKNPYLFLGPGPKRDSLVIAESRASCIKLDSEISQETCMIMLILFNMTQEEQSQSLENANRKEMKEIVKGAKCFKVRGWLDEEIKKQANIYLQNEKREEFIQKIKAANDEKSLTGVFKEFQAIKGFWASKEYLLKSIEMQYSDQNHSLLCEEAIEMLEWYLLVKRKEIFDPTLSMKEGTFCFAHSQLMNAAYEKNLMDFSLEIKKSLLNSIVFKKQDSFFHNLSEMPIAEIMNTVASVFAVMPENDALRLKLIEILQILPRSKRQPYVDELLLKPYYLSENDPLFIFLEDEIRLTGNGWELTQHLASIGGVEYTIDFLIKLSVAYPTLKFAKNLLLWTTENPFEKEETIRLIQYFLSVTADQEFLNMLTRYMDKVIFQIDFASEAHYPTIESFFIKINHQRGAYSFLLPLCKCAVKKGNFSLAIQFANWDRKIDPVDWNDMDSLDRILFSVKNENLQELADLFVQHRLNDSVDASILFPMLANTTKLDRNTYKKLFKMLIKTHSLRDLTDSTLASLKFNVFHGQVVNNLVDRLSYPMKGSMAFNPIYNNAETASSKDIAVFLVDKFMPAFNEDKIRLMDFLVRAKLVMANDINLPMVLKGILTAAERLWSDKYYDTLILFIEHFERTEYAILRLFISKVSLTHAHDAAFDRIFSLIFKYGYNDFVLKYLKSCKNYTSYQINMMNKFKANSVLSKQTF